MPNWVQNKLEITGKDARKIVAKYLDADGDFSFNKIIPMPWELDIESSSLGYRGKLFLLFFMNPSTNGVDLELENKYHLSSQEEYYTRVNKYLSNSVGTRLIREALKYDKMVELYKTTDKDTLEKTLKIGERIISNIDKYGYEDWYLWRIAKWGVKWDAHEVSVEYSDELNKYGEETVTIYFQTPWGLATPVIKQFAKDNPSLTILWYYAEEQYVAFAGWFMFMEGKCEDERDLDPESDKAKDLWCELWGMTRNQMDVEEEYMNTEADE